MSEMGQNKCPANYLYPKAKIVKFFRVSVMTSMERNEAITKISDAIGHNGGWIVNHTLLSNVAATLNFELPYIQVEDFLTKLKELSFYPVVEGDVPQTKESDLRGQVTVTFMHNKPDLKRTIPAFG
ncbi:hypothetical protein [Kiloniella antarctica]|uniref:Uncharacterized protein n=1 Tax=Kiloniella antarctica TaxID=1550907 RepID=A0ABW5BNM6_9PROT